MVEQRNRTTGAWFMYVCCAMYQCAVAKSGMKCAAAGDPRELLIDAYRYRDQPIPYFYIARPLSVFLQTPGTYE